MRLYKLSKSVEFPEKTKTGYINIRSIERIDVRPGEIRCVDTGLRISKTDLERVVAKSVWGDTSTVNRTGKRLCIIVNNHGSRSIMIYPGMVIGELTVEKT